MIRLDRESLATLAMAAVAVVNKGLLNNFGGLTDGGGGGARFAIVHTPALRKRRRHEAKEGGTEGGKEPVNRD